MGTYFWRTSNFRIKNEDFIQVVLVWRFTIGVAIKYIGVQFFFFSVDVKKKCTL